MAFNCETHGVIDSEWCGECQTIIPCDCSVTETSRVKDFRYGFDGNGRATLHITHCSTCYNILAIEW